MVAWVRFLVPGTTVGGLWTQQYPAVGGLWAHNFKTTGGRGGYVKTYMGKTEVGNNIGAYWYYSVLNKSSLAKQ